MNSEWMILSYSQSGTLSDLPRDHLIDGVILSLEALSSTPPASGSSPSVSAQASRSTSLQVWWGITPRGPPIS